MKPVSILLAPTFVASLLPSQIDAQATSAKLDLTSTLLVKAGVNIVAILPANKARTIDTSASAGAATGQQGLFYKGHVTIQHYTLRKTCLPNTENLLQCCTTK